MQDVLPDQAAATVFSALRQFEEQLRTGALVTVDVRRTRARILPLSLRE